MFAGNQRYNHASKKPSGGGGGGSNRRSARKPRDTPKEAMLPEEEGLGKIRAKKNHHNIKVEA